MGKKKKKMSVVSLSSFEEAQRDDRAYWWSRTPLERLEAMEKLRQMNYDYDPVTDRIQRFIEIVERT
ncbi:MAG: hypothetical protein COV99_00015 [Bacteroidetes bacterium CG12_big_fil_rev_8_21_14_0_65_60_17]|nr:MAG: hypothetical protein COV99_00015 [Bacteroidetes bacterium CG12_big_fil_rev_8_21_14_0_65_60_17]